MTKKKRVASKRRRASPPELSPEMQELVAQSSLILNVAQGFAGMLEELQTTRTQYAKLLKVPESHVKRVMEGRNMTLRTLASLLYAAGYHAEVTFVANRKEKP